MCCKKKAYAHDIHKSTKLIVIMAHCHPQVLLKFKLIITSEFIFSLVVCIPEDRA